MDLTNHNKMLTSSNQSNQYLRPDYLTPLPTTLDAKNSPLALLAQTCSAIGSDSPNPKLLANIEKSTKSHKSSIDSNRDKLSPNSNQSSLSNGSLDHQITIKSSFKPYESSITVRERSNLTPSDEQQHQQQQRSSSNLGANYNINSNNNSNSNNHHNNNTNTNTIRIKTPKTLHNGQQQQQRCDSNQSATSQTRDSSPAAIINGGSSSSTSSRKTPQHQRDNSDSQSPHQQRASSKDSGNISLSQNSPNTRIPNDLSKDLTSLTKSTMPNNNNSSIPSSAASYFSGYPPGLSGFPMDLLTAGFMPHHPMMKAAALNSYFNYARPKGSGGGGGGGGGNSNGGDPTPGMMPPICRDPYCTGCPMSPHVLNKATGQPCPAGCTQCDSSASKSYQQHSNAAAAYAHAQLAALAAASQLPYVCSWIAGDSAYCGKRFGTSDELFQHLRTHTASMPESMLNAVAASGLPPNHPLFQRTYPTPPLSPLSSARYHPYGKPSMYPPTLGPPSLAGLQMPQHPSLAPYFSPYSLYGPRLGASPSMHP